MNISYLRPKAPDQEGVPVRGLWHSGALLGWGRYERVSRRRHMWAPGSRLWEPLLRIPQSPVSGQRLHAPTVARPESSVESPASAPVALQDGAGRGQGDAASAWWTPRARLHTRAAAQTLQDGFAPQPRFSC